MNLFRGMKELREFDGTQIRAWTPSVFSQAAVIMLSLQGIWSVVIFENGKDKVALEAFLVARTVDANVATVKSLSDVRKIVL